MKLLRARLGEGLTVNQVVAMETRVLINGAIGGKLGLLGFIEVEGDGGSRVFLVPVVNEDGEMFSLFIKSENVSNQIDDLVGLAQDNDEFVIRQVKFEEIINKILH